MMNSKVISGLVLSLGIAAVSMLLDPFIPYLNGIIIALLLGIIISNSVKLRASLAPGIDLAAKKLLEFAIIFLGFGISFQSVASLGWQVIIILIITIVAVLGLSVVLAKVYPCKNSTGYLIGFGTAICGSTAIAALAPKIADSKKDAGIAIAVTNLVGLAGMLLFPLLFNEGFMAEEAALLTGATLHSVSNVAGAAYSMDELTGDLALTIKLGRVAMLAPAMIFYTFLLNRKTSSFKENLKLPYYIIGFIAASAIVSLFQLPEMMISGFRWMGKFLLTTSMAGIGLSIHLAHLMKDGKSAIRFGISIFLIAIAIVYLLSVLI